MLYVTYTDAIGFILGVGGVRKISKTPNSASKSYKTRTLTFKYCAPTGTKVINISLCERSSIEPTLIHDL